MQESIWIPAFTLMKRLVSILLICISSSLTKGQNNLVPNWSFENITTCNFTGFDLPKAQPWFPAKSSGGSTDLFNVCENTYYHVPNSFFGYQPAKTGNGYSGFIPFEYPGSGSTYREYAEVQLLNPLNSGKTYCVSFYINPSNVLSDCYISSIGAIFSFDTLKSVVDSLWIDTIPDISLPSIVSDTVNWSSIFGIYTCSSTKNFLTIGNFYNDYNTPYTCNLQNYAYYFLDDVSVVEVSNANAGNDTSMCLGETIQIGGQPTFAADYVWYELADSAGSNSIDSIGIARPHISPVQTTTYVMWKRQCNVVTMDTVVVTVNCIGLKEQKAKNELTVYPNPANDEISIGYTGNESEICIYDLIGKEIVRRTFDSKQTQIDLVELNNGIYFVSILNKNKIAATRKIVVQH